MALQSINYGNIPNDPNASTIQAAFEITNNNFVYLNNLAIQGANSNVSTINAGTGINASSSTGNVTLSAIFNSLTVATDGTISFANSVGGVTQPGNGYKVSDSNVAVLNFSVGNVSGNKITGAVGFASVANSVAGANVTGQVSFAAVANSVDAANVINGAVGFANIANSANTANISNISNITYSVSGANVTGAVANATYSVSSNSANSVAGANVTGTVNLSQQANIANTVILSSQPNITSVGTLVSLNVTGNITANNISANTVAGTLTTAAQTAITRVGNLTELRINGTTNGINGIYSGSLTAGSISTSGTATGNLISANAITANGSVTADTITANGSVTANTITANTVSANAISASTLMQARYVTITPQTTAPSQPGTIYYDSTSGRFMGFSGVYGWVILG